MNAQIELLSAHVMSLEAVCFEWMRLIPQHCSVNEIISVEMLRFDLSLLAGMVGSLRRWFIQAGMMGS